MLKLELLGYQNPQSLHESFQDVIYPQNSMISHQSFDTLQRMPGYSIEVTAVDL